LRCLELRRGAEQVLAKMERNKVMEWLAEARRDSSIVIRTTACPIYTLILKKGDIKTKHFSSDVLKRIPYYDKECAAGMPNGYITILLNGGIIPCMLLQIKLGNIRERNIVDIREDSPILARLRAREQLKGECGRHRFRDVCAGCRGRAYEPVRDMLSADPGCWIP